MSSNINRLSVIAPHDSSSIIILQVLRNPIDIDVGSIIKDGELEERDLDSAAHSRVIQHVIYVSLRVVYCEVLGVILLRILNLLSTMHNWLFWLWWHHLILLGVSCIWAERRISIPLVILLILPGHPRKHRCIEQTSIAHSLRKLILRVILITAIVIVMIIEVPMISSRSVQMHTEGVRLRVIEHIWRHIGLIQRRSDWRNERWLNSWFSWKTAWDSAD